MTNQLRISLLIAVIAYVLIIIYFIKKNKIALRHSLLWFFLAFCMLLMIAFPSLVSSLSRLIGVATPINAIFLMFILIILIFLLYLTSVVTKQQQQIKKLTQTLGITTNQLELLKNDLQDKKE